MKRPVQLSCIGAALGLVALALGLMTWKPVPFLVIPWLPWFLCGVCLALVIAFVYGLYSSVTKRQFLICLAISYGMASAFWLFNFQTFYDVMASTRWVEANIVRHVVTFVLSRDDINALAKGEILKSILVPGNELKRTGAAISVETKDGLPIFEKQNGRPEYTPEVFDDKPIVINGKTYTYHYQYNNRPNMWIGYARAVSLSLLYPQGVYDWRLFLIYKLYNRSSYFYVAFLFMLFVTPLGFAWKNSERQKMRDLQTFKNAYTKLSTDFAIGVNNSENNLQRMQSDMDALIAGTSPLEQSLKESSGLGRHDVLNRIKSVRTDTSVYTNEATREQVERLNTYLFSQTGYDKKQLLQDIYDVIFTPWIAKIHDELKSLDTTLEVDLKTCAVDDALRLIQDAVPDNVRSYRIYDLTYTYTADGVTDTTGTVRIIPSKFQSIIFNIIQNSLQQMERYMDGLDDEALDTYTRQLAVVVTQDATRLSIQIRDNGGGFTPAILPKIYNEPIPTAKGDGRPFGLGTSYIRFFMSFMPGMTIKASNYIVPQTTQRGACTTISLPYVTTQG